LFLGELPFDQSLVLRLRTQVPAKQTSLGSTTLYNQEYYENLLKNYFRLETDLKELYEKWIACSDHFKENSVKFRGIRQLNQDPIENIFSFICSQNNNISRISGLVEKICSKYGQKICDYQDVPYFNFPSIEPLSKTEAETELRELNFGYRAKYIQQTAQGIIDRGGLDWIQQLKKMSYKEAFQELLTLPGIGPKVGDCICLMSLNHLEAVPVDTHILQIARNYLPKLADKKKISMTPKLYQEISNVFREIYKEKAGWAQTVLFCSDIRQFNKGSDEATVRDSKTQLKESQSSTQEVVTKKRKNK
jgi:N-glycosylase/DNA lyase